VGQQKKKKKGVGGEGQGGRKVVHKPYKTREKQSRRKSLTCWDLKGMGWGGGGGTRRGSSVKVVKGRGRAAKKEA